MESKNPCMIFGKNFKQEKDVDGGVVPVPKVGMSFLSEKEMREYCSKYAESAGFDIAKRSTKCGDDGRQKYFSLACSRNGHTLSTGKTSMLHQRSSSKTNCKAKINVSIKGDDVFLISRVFLEHNHELTPGKARYFRYNKGFKPYCKRKLDLNEMASNNRTMDATSKKHRVADVVIRNSRINKGDAEVLVSFLSGMQTRDPNFFYTIDVDEEGQIKNAFWADSRCRAAYESFSDIVSFDTTYLTSYHCVLPLVSFLGINHHGQAVLLGCGIMFTQDSRTFDWLLKSWLTCMTGRHPKTLVCDDEGELVQSAIARVFPNSNSFLCLSQIMDKVPLKLQGLPKSKEIERALKNALYSSFTCGEFEDRWRKTIDQYNLIDNQWLRSLYEGRKCWVPVYMKTVFTSGIMSQKVSLSKEFFDGFVNPKTTLKQFVEQYEKAWERNIEKEKNADFVSSSFVLPTKTNHPIEKQLQKLYTNDIFKKFLEEWRGLVYCNASPSKATDGSILTFDVSQSVYNEAGMLLKELTLEVVLKEEENQMNCSCYLFQSRGVLCRHIISVLLKRNANEIPLRYILDRWRKDIKRDYKIDNASTSNNVCRESRLHVDDLSPLLFDVQQQAIKSEEHFQLLKELLIEVRETVLPVDVTCSRKSILI